MTIKDIAELAGVSVSTVSKIINNKDKHINEGTRQRVLAIIKDYNYKPYAGIKNTNNTFTIGVILPAVSDPALLPEISEILEGIISAAQSGGYAVMVVRSNTSDDSERKCLSMLISRNVSAIIWRPLADPSAAENHSLILQELEHAGLPYIVIGSSSYPNSISPDYRGMGYCCGRRMLEMHHTNVLFVSHDESERCRLMAEGFYQAYAEGEQALSDQNTVLLDTIFANAELISESCTAIFCTNALDALQMYALLEKSNYLIPENKSLYAVIQYPASMNCYPKLSGLHENCRSFGVAVAKEVIRMHELGRPAPNPEAISYSYEYSEGRTVDVPEAYRIRSILCVGTINYDCTILSDSLPQSGTTLMAHSSTYCIGGKGLNQAVGVARLGQKAILIGKIGDDAASIRIMEELTENGVLTHAVSREKNAETGKAFIQLEANGDSTITVVPGANKLVSPAYLESLESNFVNASYCMITGETSLETVACTCRLCRKYGVKSVYKPTAAKYLPDEIYPLVDYFIPNYYEASQLCGKRGDVSELAEFFLSKGCGTVIITRGSKGCYVRESLSAEGASYPASTGFSVVDTTGAADAFISTLTGCLARNLDLETSIRAAQISAGHMVSQIGTAPSMIDWETLKNHAAREGISL